LEALDGWTSLALEAVGVLEALDCWTSMALVGVGVLEAFPFLNLEREKNLNIEIYTKFSVT
jgi:hypothetical protein